LVSYGFLKREFELAVRKGFVKYFPKILRIKQVGMFKIIVVTTKREKRPRGSEEEVLRRLEKGITTIVGNETKWAIVFNQYPLLPVQLLIISFEEGKLTRRPQRLKEKDLEITELAKKLKGRIFFNSLGAGATQNFLHFQCIFEQLPVETILHPGYPASFIVLANFAQERKNLWKKILKLQAQNVPFNLLITPENVFIFPRRKEKSASIPWRRIGALEMAGVWCIRPEEEERINFKLLLKALKEVSLPLNSLPF